MAGVRARVRRALGRIPYEIGYRSGPRLMSELRKRWVLLRHPHANVVFEGPVYLGPGFSLHIPGNGSFIVGPNVEFRRGFRAEVERDGRITIGAGSVFTYYVLVQCSTTIDIGERCVFGQSSIVLDGQHRFRDTSVPVLEQDFDFTPITIENDVVVTSKCSVMANIGHHSVIGANAVVTRAIPPYSVAAGVPARVIESLAPG
jgi:acetyltransferase-like isoleucine patch superfamily enzyme